VTNGHANPHVEPRMTGWFKEQQETHGRCVTFMHLDGLVDWVVENRLVNELRAALQEEGVKIEAEESAARLEPRNKARARRRRRPRAK
jgi:hypothetical protein